MTAVDNANYRDFTKKRERIHFGLNGEDFDCRKALSPRNLQNAMIAFRSIKAEFKLDDAGEIDENKVDETNAPELLDKITDVLRYFVKTESMLRLSAVLSDDDADEPVDTVQLMEIIEWVLGKVAGRPTQPSPDSTTTSPSDGSGTSSTAGAQPAELIPSS